MLRHTIIVVLTVGAWASACSLLFSPSPCEQASRCRAILGPLPLSRSSSLAAKGSEFFSEDTGCGPNGLLRGFEEATFDNNDRLIGITLSCVEVKVDGTGILKWHNEVVGEGFSGDSDVFYSQGLFCPPNEYVVQVAGFSGALTVENPQVIDRFEIGCSALVEDGQGNVVRSGEIARIKQDPKGNILANNQTYEVANCPPDHMIGMIHASGRGLLDFLEVYCAEVIVEY